MLGKLVDFIRRHGFVKRVVPDVEGGIDVVKVVTEADLHRVDVRKDDGYEAKQDDRQRGEIG